MVEVHSGPLAAQTEDPETISTGEVKNNSVDLVEGALTLTGKNLSKLSSYCIVVKNQMQKVSFLICERSELCLFKKNVIFFGTF